MWVPSMWTPLPLPFQSVPAQLSPWGPFIETTHSTVFETAVADLSQEARKPRSQHSSRPVSAASSVKATSPDKPRT